MSIFRKTTKLRKRVFQTAVSNNEKKYFWDWNLVEKCSETVYLCLKLTSRFSKKTHSTELGKYFCCSINYT